MRINQVNVGIETLAGDNSQPNAITVEGKNLMTWCTTACIDLSTDRETGNSVSLNNLVIDNSGIGVRMRGSGENIAVRDSYFEGNTIDIDVIGFDNTNNYEDVNLQPHGIN